MNLKSLLREVTKVKKVKKEKVEKTKLELVPYIKITTELRFERSYLKVETGCWEWQGKLDRYGYGSLKVDNKTTKAHRYSYEKYYGSFNKELHVLHTCDNPKCVNPHHLFLGTNQDNVKDRVNKNRGNSTTKKLSVEAKKSMLKLLETQPKKCVADLFGVHVSTVSRVKAKGLRNVF